jgi:hypothetical protein
MWQDAMIVCLHEYGSTVLEYQVVESFSVQSTVR